MAYHEDGERTVALRLPNLEVRSVYRTIFAEYLERGGPAELKALREALFTGDAHTFQHILGNLIRDVLSYHDFDTRIPERVYHAFLAGLCVTLSADHEVRSNRESGYGRYDVMILPKRTGGPGVVMELKVLKGETVELALARAGEQLVERGYAAELRARGAVPVSGFAVVFDGKDVFVEAVNLG